jgi:hypothetical protein
MAAVFYARTHYCGATAAPSHGISPIGQFRFNWIYSNLPNGTHSARVAVTSLVVTAQLRIRERSTHNLILYPTGVGRIVMDKGVCVPDRVSGQRRLCSF